MSSVVLLTAPDNLRRYLFHQQESRQHYRELELVLARNVNALRSGKSRIKLSLWRCLKSILSCEWARGRRSLSANARHGSVSVP